MSNKSFKIIEIVANKSIVDLQASVDREEAKERFKTPEYQAILKQLREKAKEASLLQKYNFDYNSLIKFKQLNFKAIDKGQRRNLFPSKVTSILKLWHYHGVL